MHYQQKEHRHAELRHELKVRKAEVEAAGGTWGKPALSAEPWKSKYAEYTRLKEELGYGEAAGAPPAPALYSPYGDEEFVPAPVRASESDARLASGETGGGLFEALSGHLGVAVAEAAGGAGPGLSEEERGAPGVLAAGAGTGATSLLNHGGRRGAALTAKVPARTCAPAGRPY